MKSWSCSHTYRVLWRGSNRSTALTQTQTLLGQRRIMHSPINDPSGQRGWGSPRQWSDDQHSVKQDWPVRSTDPSPAPYWMMQVGLRFVVRFIFIFGHNYLIDTLSLRDDFDFLEEISRGGVSNFFNQLIISFSYSRVSLSQRKQLFLSTFSRQDCSAVPRLGALDFDLWRSLPKIIQRSFIHNLPFRVVVVRVV